MLLIKRVILSCVKSAFLRWKWHIDHRRKKKEYWKRGWTRVRKLLKSYGRFVTSSRILVLSLLTDRHILSLLFRFFVSYYVHACCSYTSGCHFIYKATWPRHTHYVALCANEKTATTHILQIRRNIRVLQQYPRGIYILFSFYLSK